MRTLLIASVAAFAFTAPAMADDTAQVTAEMSIDTSCLIGSDVGGDAVTVDVGTEFSLPINCNTTFNLSAPDFTLANKEEVTSSGDYQSEVTASFNLNEDELVESNSGRVGAYAAQNKNAKYTISFDQTPSLTSGNYDGTGTVTLTGTAPADS